MIPADQAADEFAALYSMSLQASHAADWASYYERMAPFLLSANTDIRTNAVERLTMAVLSAEPMAYRQRMPHEQAVARLQWLLDRLMDAHLQHPDIIPSFLERLRYHGDSELFCEPLRAWLNEIKNAPPLHVRPDVVQGTLVLLQTCDADGAKFLQEWLALLDQPSDYVRGCAAHMLGEWSSTTTQPTTDELFDVIKAKEIARPGIAGPFWSSLQFGYDGPINVVEWMLDILEQRVGPEPDDMVSNGVDFYLHELCDGSVAAIERMLRAGHVALALETATETPGVLEGMKEVLIVLGDHPDARIAAGAWEHLARYYHVWHPKAAHEKVQAYPQWQPGVDAVGIRQGSGDNVRDLMVLYPASATSSFDSVSAWELIDLALPPSLRGDEVMDGTYPATSVSSSGEAKHQHLFVSGAIVILEGLPKGGGWTRLEIIGRGLQGRWKAGRKIRAM